MVKKLCQRYCPIKPGWMNFNLIWIVCHNDVVNGWNVAAWLYRHHLSWANCQWRRHSSLGTNLVRGNHTYWVHQPRVVAQTKNFLPCVWDLEFALALISVKLAKKREPKQSCTMFVLRTVLPLRKKVEPRHSQLARSEEDRVWNVSVSPREWQKCWQRSWSEWATRHICTKAEGVPKTKHAEWGWKFVLLLDG